MDANLNDKLLTIEIVTGGIKRTIPVIKSREWLEERLGEGLPLEWDGVSPQEMFLYKFFFGYEYITATGTFENIPKTLRDYQSYFFSRYDTFNDDQSKNRFAITERKRLENAIGKLQRINCVPEAQRINQYLDTIIKPILEKSKAPYLLHKILNTSITKKDSRTTNQDLVHRQERQVNLQSVHEKIPAQAIIFAEHLMDKNGRPLKNAKYILEQRKPAWTDPGVPAHAAEYCIQFLKVPDIYLNDLKQFFTTGSCAFLIPFGCNGKMLVTVFFELKKGFSPDMNLDLWGERIEHFLIKLSPTAQPILKKSSFLVSIKPSNTERRLDVHSPDYPLIIDFIKQRIISIKELDPKP